MSALVDTNVLVYCVDGRTPRKLEQAKELLRKGLSDQSLRVPYQAIVEFVNVVTRPVGPDRIPLLSREDAIREGEFLLAEFEILYPTESVLRLAMRGVTAYRLSWFDALIWACAEHYGLSEILTEDFSHGQLIGRVRIRDPFRD